MGAVLKDLFGSFAGGLSVYRVIACHPTLLHPWALLRGHVVAESTLSANLREVRSCGVRR